MTNYVIRKLANRRNSLYVKLAMEQQARSKDAYAKKRVKMINGGYKGSQKEYRDVVLAYWNKYGMKPPKYWYDICCSGQDKYDPHYIPDTVWYRNIIPFFNDILMRRAYTDKCIYNRLFPDVKKPDTVVKNIAGYYFNGDQDQIITQEEAVSICKQYDKLIIKPSVDTGRGKNVTFFDRDAADKSIEDILAKMNQNFVVQQIVRQHEDLARINPSSLNTIRVVSFHFNGEVYILSALLRMGAIGTHVDNISAGGIACPIKPDGWLKEKAVTRKSEWTDHHEGGIKFADIRVPNYEDVIDTVKRLHVKLPYFSIIGWDFAVGEKGDPVIIEFNVMPEPNQISCGPTFGDLTDKVLDEVFLNKTMKKS